MNLSHRLLAFAARRWPADIRRELRREWEAEMHAIRHDMSASPLLRSLRGLRFAFSLAASPPAEDENGVPRGWRELLPERGRRLAPALLLVVATVVVAALGSVLPAMVFIFSRGMRTDLYGNPSQSTTATWSLGTAVVLMAAVVAFAGVRLAARLPMPSAAKVFGIVAATLLVLWFVAPGWPGYMRPDDRSALILDVIALAAWGTVMFAATAVATRLLRRGPWAAIAVGAVALIVLDLAAMLMTLPFANGEFSAGDHGPSAVVDFAHGPLWFPLSLVSAEPGASGNVADDVIAVGLNAWMSVLVAVTAFAVGYALRSRRAGSPVAAHAAAPAVTATAVRGLVPARWAAGAIGVVAMGFWAAALNVAPGENFAPIVAELRLAALLTVVLSGAVVLTGLGRPLLAAGIAAPLLLGLDIAVDRLDVDGIAGIGQAVGLAAVLLVTAWWLSDRILPGKGTSATGPLTTVAVLAAFSTIGRVTEPVAVDTSGIAVAVPNELITAATWMSVLIVLLATVAAIAARGRGLHPDALIPLAVGALVLFGSPNVFEEASVMINMVVSGVMTACVFFAVRWDGLARSIPKWSLAVLAAGVICFPVAILCSIIARPVAMGLALASGHDATVVTDATLPGTILVGTAVAVLAALLPTRLPKGVHIPAGRPDPVLP